MIVTTFKTLGLMALGGIITVIAIYLYIVINWGKK